LLSLHPFALFGNRRRTVIAPFHERALMLYLSRVDHYYFLLVVKSGNIIPKKSLTYHISLR
jgi:hypothetical protein